MSHRLVRRARPLLPSHPLAWLALSASVLGPALAQAQAIAPSYDGRYRDERVKVIREKLERTPDVLGTSRLQLDPSRLPTQEAPCFLIDRISLKGDDAGEFAWLAPAMAGPAGDDAPQGKCLGAQGINLVLRRLQNALVEHGDITTRVAAEAQDLKSGALDFLLTPGRVNAVRLAPDSPSQTRLASAMPSQPGAVLNLRDVEHGLENLKRVPGADADIKIVPGEQPGQSDLVVSYRQGKPFRGAVSLDDSGSKATGKRQIGLTLSYDNPTGLSDLLYLTLNRNLGSGGGLGSKGTILHYSVPFGYWSASVTHDNGRHHQTVVGAFENYLYSGRSANTELKLSRLLRRDATSKTTASLGVFQRRASNFIDDTEVEVQRRRTGGWLATLNHRHNFGPTSLEATLGLKQGTGDFGAIPAPEEFSNEGSSRFTLGSADLILSGPLSLLGQELRYLINWRGQLNRAALAAPERFSIGGRHTVRGFDGEAVLSGDRGLLMRNELAKSVLQGRLEAYVGVDLGVVGGPSTERRVCEPLAVLAGLCTEPIVGKRLAGAVVGARGQAYGLQYDLFVGTPLSKPESLKTAGTTAGFNLSYGF